MEKDELALWISIIGSATSLCVVGINSYFTMRTKGIDAKLKELELAQALRVKQEEQEFALKAKKQEHFTNLDKIHYERRLEAGEHEINYLLTSTRLASFAKSSFESRIANVYTNKFLYDWTRSKIDNLTNKLDELSLNNSRAYEGYFPVIRSVVNAHNAIGNCASLFNEVAIIENQISDYRDKFSKETDETKRDKIKEEYTPLVDKLVARMEQFVEATEKSQTETAIAIADIRRQMQSLQD